MAGIGHTCKVLSRLVTHQLILELKKKKDRENQRSVSFTKLLTSLYSE